MTTTKELERAHRTAKATLAVIVEQVNALTVEDKQESARQEIQEWPLSIEVRTDWHTPGAKDGNKPAAYRILLATGGPAIQIVGLLDEHQQPETAKLQYQDWYTPWTGYETTEEEDKALLRFACEFFFGE